MHNEFLNGLKPDFKVPDHIQVMVPFENNIVREINQIFFKKFYADSSKRILILGINPGRFGAGVTGIPFTDPIRLQDVLQIKNEFPKKSELSSIFIYQMIELFGGADEFFRKFYISAVSPLGFVSGGKNINYYDDKELWSGS